MPRFIFPDAQNYLPLPAQRAFQIYSRVLEAGPAINFIAEVDGHVMLMYQSADEYVHYTHFETFADFITEKKAGDILAQHQSRGLSETQFTERYKRFGKASMFIGKPNTNNAELRLMTQIWSLNLFCYS